MIYAGNKGLNRYTAGSFVHNCPFLICEVKIMKRKIFFAAVISAILLCGCSGGNTEAPQQGTAEQVTELAVASKDDMVTPESVGYEGMQALTAEGIKDGVYDINVDSSSSMFKITECKLTAANGEMTAKMTMSGSGYGALYMGTAEEAAAAPESEDISFIEENGVHIFEVPVEALDKEIACAAFSIKKQLWYDRTLVFRADSLPADAFKNTVTTETLGLSDGEYTAEVTLSGGSGKASVQSPTRLKIDGGKAYAEIVWSSNKYDYMIVDGEKYLPSSTQEFSVFEIPVSVFDRVMSVKADTTAMSQPYEIDYGLCFDSSSVKENTVQ